MPIEVITNANLPDFCKILAGRDEHLQSIIDRFGFPPLWKRPCNFDTLVFIILEQQVSLASARATYHKLRSKMNGELTVDKLLVATDEDLIACSVTRQKRSYIRHLTKCLVDGKVDLSKLELQTDEEVSLHLQQVKGIGNWSCDIFLMEVLNRADRFPLGDIALLNSLRGAKGLDKKFPVSDLAPIIDHWRPYRTAGAFLLWHWYIQTKGLTPPEYHA